MSQASGFYSPLNGEEVIFHLADKLVYSYMRQRFVYFNDKMKSKHYETQDTVAKAVGIARQTAIRSLKLFMHHGVIEGYKTRLNGVGQSRWVYTNVSPLDTWKEDRTPLEIPITTVRGDGIPAHQTDNEYDPSIPDWAQ